MSYQNVLEAVTFGPQENAEAAPKNIVVFLHGVGADKNDLIELAPLFADALPNTLFISPDAPFAFDMAPFGRQWFSLQDRDPAVMRQGAEEASGHLNAFLDAVLETYDLPAAKLAVVGFSQGTMTGLYTLIRRDVPVAGFVGYSGMLLAEEATPDQDVDKFPIRLIHGQDDDVVPAVLSQDGAEKLKSWGYDIDAYYQPGLGHGIDPEGIALAKEFLVNKLK